MEASVRVVILAGGSGTRLYPISREDFPKQFISIFGQSFLEKAYRRAQVLVSSDSILVSTKKSYHFLVQDLLGEEVNILGEPVGRNTAPAAFYSIIAGCEVYGWSLQDVYLFMPSDHEIWPEDEFVELLRRACILAHRGHIALVGIPPTRPERGYGYIELAQRKDDYFLVSRFKEKPDASEVAELFNRGNCLWNLGVYVSRGDVFMEELVRLNQEFSPYTALPLEDLGARFQELPSISIDCAIAEKTNRLVALGGGFSWCDIGTWDALYSIGEKDRDRNVRLGKVVPIRSRSSLLIGEGRLLVTQGIEDLLVVETPDVVFVGKREHAQEEGEIVNHLMRLGYKEARDHVTVHKPWGHYTVLIDAPGYKVKRISVKPGKRLSLQYHRFRAEHWVVVRGLTKVILGEREIILKENESAFVPKLMPHRLENIGLESLEIVEVQTGEYIGEDDIVRIEDDWGRREVP